MARKNGKVKTQYENNFSFFQWFWLFSQNPSRSKKIARKYSTDAPKALQRLPKTLSSPPKKPKMAPRRLQHAFRRSKKHPKHATDTPKTRQDCPRHTQTPQRHAQYLAKARFLKVRKPKMNIRLLMLLSINRFKSLSIQMGTADCAKHSAAPPQVAPRARLQSKGLAKYLSSNPGVSIE